MAYRVIRKGVDTLDVAFQGKLPAALLRQLRSAKAQAASSQRPVLISLGDVSGHVGDTGARGGYAFRFDTGPLGEIWTIKDNTDLEQWNLRVTVKALQLALDGYEKVKDNLWSRLENWGARVLTESVSRCDFAIDFASDDFVLRPDDFIFHSHSRCQEHRDIPSGGSGFAVERRSGRVTGVTVGKMPSRQVAVYDKRLEQAYKVGSPWFQIWGFEKENCPRIWRVEMRAGKTHLKEWGITKFEDLERYLVEMFGSALQAVRLTSGRDALNVSRSETHPFWQLAADEVEAALRGWVPDTDAREIVNATRAAVQEMYRKQVAGLQVSYAVALGLSKQEAAEQLMDTVTADWLSLAKGSPSVFGKKFQTANERLHFLKEEQLADGNADGISNQVPG